MYYERLEGYRKECPLCNKEFYATSSWVYKIKSKEAVEYYCSWKCLQAKRQEEKNKKKHSSTDKWWAD